jgi:hypothetical protein
MLTFLAMGAALVSKRLLEDEWTKPSAARRARAA